MTTSKTRTSRIAGQFRGYCPQSLFKLQDGTYWLQIDSRMSLHQSQAPKAEILCLDDGMFLKVAGMEKSVMVKQLHDVIESHIRGKFSGWTGRTVYTLTNGQTWQQTKFQTKYAVKYMPEVLIYNSVSGPIMHVAGTSVAVKQIK